MVLLHVCGILQSVREVNSDLPIECRIVDGKKEGRKFYTAVIPMRNVRVLYLHTSAKCMLQSSSFSNALIDMNPLTKTIGQDGQVKSRRMLRSMKPRRDVVLELVKKNQDLMYVLGQPCHNTRENHGS
jgi:hypothetical protein